MVIKKIAHIGANGRLGPVVLNKLVAAKAYSITVLSRSSSKSKYPDSVKVIEISDNPSTEELTDALRGQDAAIITTGGSHVDLQISLADAAVAAGVQLFVPADFGSCDSNSARALELIPLYRGKQKVREHLQKLASTDNFAWTSLVCGHFFDYGLKSGLLSVDLQNKKIMIFDGGNVKWSASTLDTIATAIVRILEKTEEVKNSMLYIQSFAITQNQLLKSLEKVTNGKWQIEEIDSSEYIEERKAILKKDPDNHEANEDLVSVVGILDSYWEKKRDFANPILGLKDQDLDEAVEMVIQTQDE